MSRCGCLRYLLLSASSKNFCLSNMATIKEVSIVRSSDSEEMSQAFTVVRRSRKDTPRLTTSLPHGQLDSKFFPKFLILPRPAKPLFLDADGEWRYFSHECRPLSAAEKKDALSKSHFFDYSRSDMLAFARFGPNFATALSVEAASRFSVAAEYWASSTIDLGWQLEGD